MTNEIPEWEESKPFPNPQSYCAKNHATDILCFGKCEYCGGTRMFQAGKTLGEIAEKKEN